MGAVVITLTAREKLEQRFARQLAEDSAALGTIMREIEEKLRRVFPNGKVVIVQDLYSGFRVRTEEYVLLVEIAKSGTEDGLSVVKLGPVGRLKKELKNWRSCRPPGLRHDIILMDLEPRHDPRGRMIALLYTDAEQLIGVDQTILLESAFLESVRLGVPTPQSVADVLFQQYERLGLLFYRHSYDDDPAAKKYRFDPKRLDRHLVENLKEWKVEKGPLFVTQSTATTATDDTRLRDHFRDPAYMLNYIVERISNHGEPAARYLPRLLRGRAHGDLHGRNVLVGRVGDRVLWPAVYDYGDMGRDNLIGWDFVKMETELKLRAYPELFANEELVPAVVRFEVDLFTDTENYRRAGKWPEMPTTAKEHARLKWLLLMLRRIASVHLGANRDRSQFWLTELYFLLAVYGLNSARFANLSPVQQLAAYVSAGCAAARYAWNQ
jgi:hypothetical protein